MIEGEESIKEDKEEKEQDKRTSGTPAVAV